MYCDYIHSPILLSLILSSLPLNAFSSQGPLALYLPSLVRTGCISMDRGIFAGA